jgi:four helix bundle protein
MKARTKKFAVDVIRFCRGLPRTEEARVIARQLIRAGTAVGAHYRAVCQSRSDPEFVAKLGMMIEESDESAYWLELLVEADIVKRLMIAALHAEADALTRNMVASRETVRRRIRARQSHERRQRSNQKPKTKDQK